MFKTMNSRYLREIPLKILNRKIGDEHVTLLQACYDNPIFHEEDAKRVPQQNGGTTTTTEKAPGNPPVTDYNGVEACNNSHDGRGRGLSSGGHAASEYMHSLPPTSPTSNDVTFRGHRKRKRRCILCTICVCVALVVGIGLLIYLLEGDQSSDSKISSPSAISVSRVEVNLTLRAGPFSVYQQDYKRLDSDASKLLRRAFVYKINDVFSSSDLSYINNKTEIKRISNTNGSVSLMFFIRPRLHVTCPANCEALITNLLVKGLEDSLFIVDSKSVAVQIVAGHCLPIQYKGCMNQTGYATWTPPNILGHMTNQEVNSYLSNNRYLLSNGSQSYPTQFYCSAFFPNCPRVGTKPILPCKQFCKDVKTYTQKDYDKRNITMPFYCDDLSESDDPKNCTQNPYTPGKCVPVTKQECLLAGFNNTAFPNVIGSLSVDSTADYLLNFITTMQAATQCFKHSLLFGCSIITPPCSGRDPPYHYVPPCRSFCQKYKDRCEIFLNVFQHKWPANVNCSALPDSPDKSVCTGYAEAREPEDRVCFNGQARCSGDKNMCIDKNWLCDGIQDCPDNSDEKHCAMCGPNEDRCSTVSALCINKAQGCDGSPDCYGESDETYCVRVEPSIEDEKLQIRNPLMDNRWEEVCQDGWTNDFSNMTCRQLGYSKSMATYFTVQDNDSYKSRITTLNNGSDPNRLQSYLEKGLRTCPSGNVVQLLCWKAVCGARPAHLVNPVRVLGGQSVRPGTWPWMVSLHGGSGERFFCGASIIGDEWILTAAHCVGWADNETDYWTIKTGNTRRDVYSEYRQVRKPKRLFRHRDFTFQTVENDIALIQLEKPFKLNDYVRAICLPDVGTMPATRCMVTGWGKTDVAVLNYQQALRQVTVDVTSWTHCYNALHGYSGGPPYELKKTMFCAGGTYAHDGCQGDSGGPLVCKKPNTTDEWYQSGVVSWGIVCGLPNVPGVYTNLTLYRDWINQVITNNTKNTDGGVVSNIVTG